MIQRQNMNNCHVHNHDQRRGSVTVEMAFVLPILFALLLGAVDFSRANMIRNTVDNAVFEASRTATIPGATETEIKEKAVEILSHLSIKNPTITVTPAIITTDTPQVTVQISVNLSENLYTSSQFLSGKTLSKSCTLTREQFAVEVLE